MLTGHSSLARFVNVTNCAVSFNTLKEHMRQHLKVYFYVLFLAVPVINKLTIVPMVMV